MNKNIKNLALVALAVLMAAPSCRKASGTGDLSAELTFSASMETKAGIDDAAALATSGFGVYAWLHGTTAWTDIVSGSANLFINQKVTSDDSGVNWKYTPTKYWPAATDIKMSFFAYAPYSTISDPKGITLPGAAKPKIAFELATDQAAMVDLLADAVVDQTRPAGDVAVSFSFNHLLTRLLVRGKSATTLPDGMSIVVKSVSIVQDATSGPLYGKAEYSFAGSNEATDIGTWASHSDRLGTVAEGKATYALTILDDGGVSGAGVSFTTTDTTTDKALTNSLYLIPLASGNSSSLKLKIGYEVNRSGGSSQVFDKEVDFPADMLTMSSANTLVLSISPGGVVVVKPIFDDTWTLEPGEYAYAI